MRNIYCGVDPGKKGGYAFIAVDEHGQNVTAHAWDDEGFIRDISEQVAKAARHGGNVYAMVEDVHSLPNEGVKSAFSFGKSCGFIEGVLRSNRVPYQLVIPRKWKKEWSLTNDKKQSIDTCKKLFPNLNLRATERCRTDSDGLAEATLIAEYGRRHM